MSAGYPVTLEKLILEGFGPYREPVEFEFTSGINCYVQENEKGKSTMVAGLIATLFGLSHRQRTLSPYTLERFRNWEQPSRCRGEVIFTAGEQHYRVCRDFDSHRVELWQLDRKAEVKDSGSFETLRMGTGDVLPAGKEEEPDGHLLLEGTHNPDAHRPLKEYEEKLQQILGMGSRQLFGDTFCVEQPLPEPDRLSDELQGLLSGGKGTAFSGALGKLAEGLKKLTRFAGPNDRGVTGRNLTKEGELERLEGRIRELEEKIQNAREAADSLVDVQEQLGRVEEELREKSNELDKKEKSRKALSDWQNLRSEYRTAARDRDRLKEATRQAGDLKEKIRLLTEEVEREYPEFSSTSPETGDKLNELVNLDRQTGEREENQNAIEHELQTVARWLEELKQDKLNYTGWEHLGADPVEKLKYVKRSAESCLREWEQFKRDVEEMEKINRELQEKYSVFENASPRELEEAENYHRRYGELSANAERFCREQQQAEAKVDEYQQACVLMEQKYSDLDNLPGEIEEVAQAAEEKLETMQTLRHLEKRSEELSGKVSVPAVLRAGGAMVLSLLAGVSLFVATANVTLLLAVLLVSAPLGAWLAGAIYGTTVSRERKELEEVYGEILRLRDSFTALDNKLGEYAADDEARLGGLLQRLRQLKEERERLKEKARELPGDEELEQIRQKCRSAEEELEQFRQRMRPFTASFNDVPVALNRWRTLRKKKKELEERRSNFAVEKLGCSPEKADSVNPLSENVAGEWQETARFMQIAGQESSCGSVGELALNLKELTEDWWKQQEENAREVARLNSEISSLESKAVSLESRLEEEKKKLQELLALKEEYSRLPGISRVLEKNGQNAAAALERWKQMQEKLKEKESLDIRLNTLLQNYGVDDVEELQGQYSMAEDNVNMRLSRWEEHVNNNPGLPGINQAEDLEQVNRYQEKLEEEIAKLQEQKESLEKTRSELIKRQAALEGENPVNIAAAELELQEFKQKKENMEISADALELAYKELELAINEYSRTYKERLEEKASSYCQEISGVNKRKVILDDDFNLQLQEEGRICGVDHLSKGARDQLYLALRFAVADLLSDEIKIPLIFDDPFTSSDQWRLENIYRILCQHSQERQFILLSHAETFTAWGEQVKKRSP